MATVRSSSQRGDCGRRLLVVLAVLALQWPAAGATGCLSTGLLSPEARLNSSGSIPFGASFGPLSGVSSLALTFSISHTSGGYLDVNLQSPGGLFIFVFHIGGQFVMSNVQFTPNAPIYPTPFPAAVANTAYSIGGHWDPQLPQPAGEWRLLVTNEAGATVGADDVLHSWSLTVCDRNMTGTPTPTPTNTPLNLQAWALTSLYFATNGRASWLRSDNWLTLDPCSGGWYGVVCAGATVVALQLPANGLSGPLPLTDLLHGLPQLGTLDLSGNALVGALTAPASHQALRVLQLAGNALGGLLPPTLFTFPALETVDLSRNRFSGALPAFWPQTGAAALRAFNVSGNLLAGLLPNPAFSVATQPQFEVLSVARNPGLRGAFPSRLLSKLVGLRVLEASYTGLGGALPEQIPSLTALQQLSLSHCLFTGLPAGVGATQLAIVELDGNLLQGALPDWLFSPQLAVLRLANNSLGGAVALPSAVLPNLRVLDFSQNLFTAFSADNDTLPQQLAQLAVLNLTHNQLSGPVPTVFANQSAVHLRSNRWDCPLPPWSWGDRASTECWVAIDVISHSLPMAQLQCGGGALRLQYVFTVSAPVPRFTFAAFTVDGGADLTDYVYPFVEYTVVSSEGVPSTGRCLLPAPCGPGVAADSVVPTTLELAFFVRGAGTLRNLTVEVAADSPLILGSGSDLQPAVELASPPTAALALLPAAAPAGGTLTVQGTCFVPGETVCTFREGDATWVTDGTVASPFALVCPVPSDAVPSGEAELVVSLDGGLTASAPLPVRIIGSPRALALNAGGPQTRSAEVAVPVISVVVVDQDGLALPLDALQRHAVNGTATCVFRNTSYTTELLPDGSYEANASALAWPVAGLYPVYCFLPALNYVLRAGLRILPGQAVNLTVLQQPSAASDNRHPLDVQPVLAIVDAVQNVLFPPLFPAATAVTCRSLTRGALAGNYSATADERGRFVFQGVTVVGVYGVPYVLQFRTALLPAAAAVVAAAPVRVQPCQGCLGTLLPVAGSAVCRACPAGAVCGAGDEPAAQPGYWAWRPAVLLPCPQFNPSVLDRAQRQSFCTGGARGHQCAPGHGGPLCSVCQPGWGRVVDLSCAPCRGRKASFALFSFTFIAYGLVVGFVALVSLRIGTGDNVVVTVFRQTVDHCQLLFRVGEMLRGAWPLLLQHLFDKAYYLSEFPLRLAFEQCGPFWTPYQRYVAYMLVPPVVSAGPALLAALYLLLPDAPSIHYPTEPQKALQPPPELRGAYPYRSRVRAVYTIAQTTLACALVGFLVSYSLVVHYSAAWLACEPFPDGASYLTFDRAVDCQSSQYRRYRKAAISTLCIYSVGMLFLPLLAALAIKGARGEMIMRRLFSYFVGGFRERCWWWYSLVTLRKLIVILIVVFVHSMVVRACLVVLLLAVALSLQLRALPYADNNELEFMSLCSLIATAVLGPIFTDLSTTVVRPMVRRFVTVIIFIIQVFVILAHLFFLLREATRWLNRCLARPDARQNPNAEAYDAVVAATTVPSTPRPPMLPYPGPPVEMAAYDPVVGGAPGYPASRPHSAAGHHYPSASADAGDGEIPPSRL